MSKNKGLRSVITKEYLQREYLEKGRTASDIGKEFGCSHENILCYLKKFGLQRGQIKNPNVAKLTKENLQIMPKKEHDKLHAELRWKSGAFRAL